MMDAAAKRSLAALALLLAVCPSSRAQEDRRKQEIAWDELPARTVGDPAFDLTAKASSGLPVAYVVVEGPAVLDGKKLKLTDVPGLVLVRATQAGNDVFLPAKPVERGFSVNPRPSPPSFVLEPKPFQAEVGSFIVLTAAVSGVPPPSLQWRRNGVPLAGATESTLTIASAAMSDDGDYDLVASNPSGSQASHRVRVSVVKRHQSISFQGPTNGYSGQPIAINVSASSGLPVHLEVVAGLGTINGTTLTAGSGTVVVQATQAGDADTEAATPAIQTFTISGQAGLHPQ